MFKRIVAAFLFVAVLMCFSGCSGLSLKSVDSLMRPPIVSDIDNELKTAFENGAAAAVKGAKYTETIVARMGRAGTVGERSLGYPDAGAYGLGVIFTELSRSLR